MRPTLIATLLFAFFSATAHAEQAGTTPPNGQAHPALLKKCDKDGDGKLNQEERGMAREMCEKRVEEFKAKHPKAFAKCDKDGDGKLNAEERSHLRKCLAKHRGDGKGDGKGEGKGEGKGKRGGA